LIYKFNRNSWKRKLCS